MSEYSRSNRTRPPETKRCASIEIAMGTIVIPTTQKLERPFINTVVVGGAGANSILEAELDF